MLDLVELPRDDPSEFYSCFFANSIGDVWCGMVKISMEQRGNEFIILLIFL